jgi:glycosyltransferase involved in cell wall biosynthesis
MPLVSIIIPVYNAEKFLASCIDSVLAQSVKDFELLLINDGSKDSSPAICRDFAQRDSRVRLFDKPNGGVSSARNMGLDEARGEWVMFVDSDDWLTEDALEVCLAHAPKYDIIRCSCTKLLSKDRKEPYPIAEIADTNELFRLLLGRGTIRALWGALYRRSLFEDNNIRFNPQISFGEDWLLSMQLALVARTIKTLPESYCYIYNTINASSCTNNLSVVKLVEQLRMMKIIRGMLGDRADSYEDIMRTTRCKIVREMLRFYSFRAVCNEIKRVRTDVDFITTHDISGARISWTKRLVLRSFLCYCRMRGVK